MELTPKEARLLDALKRVKSEAKKSKPDADKIYDIAAAAMIYEHKA